MVRFVKLTTFLAVTFLAARARAYVDEVQPSPGFQQYRPIYALLGEDETKLQLSFKVRVLPLLGLYAAYSQVMIWRLFDESRPFRDINYNPELFYRLQFGESPTWYVDVGLYEHESNGREEADSRSWDRSYVRYSMTHALSKTTRARIHWNMKAWIAYGYDPTNRDIQRYRGAYEGQVSLVDAFGPWFDRGDITWRIFGGGASHVNPFKGGSELTLRFAPKLLSSSVAQIVVQWFYGYGEDLIDYNRKKTMLRAGLGF